MLQCANYMSKLLRGKVTVENSSVKAGCPGCGAGRSFEGAFATPTFLCLREI